MNIYERKVRTFIKEANNGKQMSYPKAIRNKCIDCCGFQYVEVKECPCKDTCPLWHFRMGRNNTIKRSKKSGMTSERVPRAKNVK